jgi:hypothetical protein
MVLNAAFVGSKMGRTRLVPTYLIGHALGFAHMRAATTAGDSAQARLAHA